MAMERWILISNCQTYGLAHSLQMLAEGVTVEPLDVSQYSREIKQYNARFGEYDRVLAGLGAAALPNADFSRAPRVDKFPELSFSAYHPDLTYIVDGPTNIMGPLEAYHSMIAFVAHGKGRSVADTLPLFNARTYAACGYLDRWATDRDNLTVYCGSCGLDVGQAVRRWGRRGAFMYSINHPRIHVLYDLARIYLEREGYEARVSDVLPHDNLANGGVFPVYPEIGDALGVPGSYLFKLDRGYTQIGLPQYVEECFAVYDRHPPGALAPHAIFRATYERVASVLDGAGEAR